MTENDNIARLTLTKQERLNSTKAIERLFASRTSFVRFPLRVVYAQGDECCAEGTAPCRMVVSVSKRRFRRAVKRNRVKRLVREAFRHKKSIVAQAGIGRCVDVAFIYIGDEMPTQERITQAVEAALTRIVHEIDRQK